MTTASRDPSPASRPAPGTPEVRLVPIPPEAMAALAEGEEDRASALAGVPLGSYLPGEECAWLWPIRLRDTERDPAAAHWVARAALADPGGPAVGHAGFHGPPDGTGMVEVGDTVDPLFRRKGYGRALVRALLRWAAAEPEVSPVRACISPTNAASLAAIAGFGFEQVAHQWDEEDGLETVYELPL